MKQTADKKSKAKIWDMSIDKEKEGRELSKLLHEKLKPLAIKLPTDLVAYATEKAREENVSLGFYLEYVLRLKFYREINRQKERQAATKTKGGKL